MFGSGVVLRLQPLLLLGVITLAGGLTFAGPAIRDEATLALMSGTLLVGCELGYWACEGRPSARLSLGATASRLGQIAGIAALGACAAAARLLLPADLRVPPALWAFCLLAVVALAASAFVARQRVLGLQAPLVPSESA